MKKKKNKDNKFLKIIEKIKNSKVATFLNDPKPIIIVLMIICVLFIIAFANYKSKYKVYNGNLESENVYIRAVHIFIHPKMNVFYSSGATYTGEDKKVYQYRIGYYYETNDGYNFLKESKDELTTAVDLADIISRTSYFDYSESQVAEHLVFTREAQKNLGKLHFMVFASTTKETDDDFDIKIDCPIDFTEF